MFDLAEVICLLLTGLVVLVTLVPIHPGPHWAVRMWDFPRLQIAAVAAGVAAGSILTGQSLLLLPLLAAIVYQGWWIFPYTPFGHTEIDIAPIDAERDTVLLAANIEMVNSDRTGIIEVIRETDPDVLFLMETDQDWIDTLQPVLDTYTTVVAEPKDNYYGMVFATRLDVGNVEVVYITGDDTPTLLAEIVAPTGDRFRFLGLHPRPPVPGEDTVARDDQLTYAARFGKVEDMDLVVMGDFNDVVWSRKSRYFKRVGGYLDPRHGRGLISSFHAKYPFLRFPIDHFFVTAGVVVSTFERGRAIGSDHFPMIARVRFDAEDAARRNTPATPIPLNEETGFKAMVERHRKKLDRNKPPAQAQ